MSLIAKTDLDRLASLFPVEVADFRRLLDMYRLPADKAIAYLAGNVDALADYDDQTIEQIDFELQLRFAALASAFSSRLGTADDPLELECLLASNDDGDDPPLIRIRYGIRLSVHPSLAANPGLFAEVDEAIWQTIPRHEESVTRTGLP